MDLTAFLFIFLVGVFFYWVGSQYSNKFFAVIAAMVFLSSGWFVVDSGISYDAVANYSTSFSPDYSAFFDDSTSCVNCSDCAGNCSGEFDVDWCAQYLTEGECRVCDQCEWFEPVDVASCWPVQDAACDASLTCEDCGCNYTVGETSYCCEHDVNETRTGYLLQSVGYEVREVDAGLSRVIGWMLVLSGLYTVLVSAVAWRRDE